MGSLRVVLLGVALNVGVGLSATYYVSPNGSGGACDQANPCDFQTALTKAQSDGQDSTIVVGKGTYTLSNTLSYSVLDGDGNLTIQAQDPSDKPVLDGQGNVRIMYINNDGNVDEKGDAGVRITLKNLVFKRGKEGLYILTAEATTLIENCEFHDNSIDGFGGGISISTNAGENILNANLFYNNSAMYGGGAYLSAGLGKNTLTNNIFYNNNDSSIYYGGGAYVRTDSGINILTNNTFYNNSATNNGGGVFIYLNYDSAQADIYNNIFWNNTSSMGGNDLYIDNDGDSNGAGSTVRVFNNNFGVKSDFTTAQSEDFIVVDSGSYSYGNNLTQDPMFVDPANGDLNLKSNSPMINKGEPNAPSLPSTDFEGNPRVVGGAPDIGAYEYNSLPQGGQPGTQQPPTSPSTGGGGGGGCNTGSSLLLLSLLIFAIPFFRRLRG